MDPQMSSVIYPSKIKSKTLPRSRLSSFVNPAMYHSTIAFKSITSKNCLGSFMMPAVVAFNTIPPRSSLSSFMDYSVVGRLKAIKTHT